MPFFSILNLNLLDVVFLPTIDLMCDPDYLNEKIITYLVNRENMRISLNRKFSYAPTYEEFVKMIKLSNNIDELKQFHHRIMNEIMQATIISEFKDGKLVESRNNSLNSLSPSIISSGSSSFYVSMSYGLSENDQTNNNVNSSKKTNLIKIPKLTCCDQGI